MSSGTEIIQAALMRIGAHSLVAPAPPESIIVGRDTLNSMLMLWLSQDIDLGIAPLDAPGDKLDEPLDTRQGIIDNLAIMLAPNFDNGKTVVSQTLVFNARIGFITIKSLYENLTIPDKVLSSTLPRGAGNTRGTLPRIFAGKGATTASSDS